jgi:cephalosporin hydroxylase
MDYKKIASLRKYVRVKENKNTKVLERSGFNWISASAKERLSYEIDWMGVPIIQTPEDIVLMQELIFNVQPDVIIETGIAHGGGLILYASLFEVLGKGKVIGVDVDIREHNRKVLESHPLFKRIELIEGSSVDQKVVEDIKKRIPEGSTVLVCLDSDHTKPHVLKELEIYQQFVSLGGYMVVFDTVTSNLICRQAADNKYIDNSPMEAVREFLKRNKNFEIDKNFNKLYVSSSPDGYLKRIK